MAEDPKVDVEAVTAMLLADRALAHQRGQSSAAAQSSMGIAKLYGQLENSAPSRAGSQRLEDSFDAELIELARANHALVSGIERADCQLVRRPTRTQFT